MGEIWADEKKLDRRIKDLHKCLCAKSAAAGELQRYRDEYIHLTRSKRVKRSELQQAVACTSTCRLQRRHLVRVIKMKLTSAMRFALCSCQYVR